MKKLLLLFIAISLLGCGEKEEKIVSDDDITWVDDIVYYKHDMSLVTGKVRSWESNGQLSKELTFKDGKLDGDYKFWFSNGQLFIEETYKDGKKVGVHKEWHRNGQLDWEKTFNDDEKVGVWKHWNEDGILIREVTWKDGKSSIKEY